MKTTRVRPCNQNRSRLRSAQRSNFPRFSGVIAKRGTQVPRLRGGGLTVMARPSLFRQTVTGSPNSTRSPAGLCEALKFAREFNAKFGRAGISISAGDVE